MKAWSASRLLVLCGSSALFAALVAGLCLLVGSTGWGWPTASLLHNRWPSVATAALVGAALSAAGVTYQAVLRNPLAEPYLLGVSGGASLLAYLAAISTGTLAAWLDPLGQQSASFVGALAALAMVLLLSQRRGRLEPVTLLLVGVIVSALCGALYLLVYHLHLRSEGLGTGGPFRFLVGSINTNLTTSQLLTATGIIGLGFAGLLYLSGQLNVAMLSEAEAESLGVRIHRLRWIALILASLITAAAVAISGPIGFVGLVCPHLARLIVGTDPRRLLPIATAFGAALLMVADAISRAASRWTDGTLPVGVLTGLLGGPFFLFLLWRGRTTVK